jgi:excisionase family DNA binding protein
LRALREAAGLTQVALVAASGVTWEAISRLESGHTAPRAETERALAHALEVTPERFVGHDLVGVAELTVADAAARLEVPVGRVQRWLRTGRLSGIRVCRQWRVPAAAIDELARGGQLRGHSQRPAPRDRA